MTNRYHPRQKHAVKMELQKQANLAAGLVADRFPTVSGIVIHMSYYRTAEVPLLMVRTVNIFPSSYAIFMMNCMVKSCDGGGFDLTPIVAHMVKTHTKVKKGVILCPGTTDPVSTGHASIKYETVIRYKSASRDTQ